MLKAVLRKGVIVPLEPLPPEWEEGAALEVSKTDGALLDIDAWAQSMNKLCADSPVEDEETMRVGQPQNITSFFAQQRVTQYVMLELSSQLYGDTPELTVGERVYWSVPVVFALPGKGVLGRVGMLRVDAGTGELLTDPQTEQEMMDHAQQLAQRALLSTGA